MMLTSEYQTHSVSDLFWVGWGGFFEIKMMQLLFCGHVMLLQTIFFLLIFHYLEFSPFTLLSNLSEGL